MGHSSLAPRTGEHYRARMAQNQVIKSQRSNSDCCLSFQVRIVRLAEGFCATSRFALLTVHKPPPQSYFGQRDTLHLVSYSVSGFWVSGVMLMTSFGLGSLLFIQLT